MTFWLWIGATFAAGLAVGWFLGLRDREPLTPEEQGQHEERRRLKKELRNLG